MLVTRLSLVRSFSSLPLSKVVQRRRQSSQCTPQRRRRRRRTKMPLEHTEDVVDTDNDNDLGWLHH